MQLTATALRGLHALAADLLDLVAPPLCAACDAPYPAQPPLCASCRTYLLAADERPADVSVAFEHGASLARAIYRAKYDGDPNLAVALGALLVETFEAPPEPDDAIVPVPLHPRRLRERGYNQARELARPLARHLRVPVLTDVVERARDTPSQTRLDRAARRRNVADAFTVTRPEGVRGRRVLLVDDVVTTGATLASLRATILATGARSVRSVALSRAALAAGAPSREGK
ncbi:MAG: ComF family protein [Polyangiales bacterium]